MEARELRIGNLVDDGLGNFGQVNTVILQILEDNPNNTYQPIPLTPSDRDWETKIPNV